MLLIFVCEYVFEHVDDYCGVYYDAQGVDVRDGFQHQVVVVCKQDDAHACAERNA